MSNSLDQLNGSKKTPLEQKGDHFSFDAPVTEAVSVGDTIAVGFGDGTIRFLDQNIILMKLRLIQE